SGRRGRRPPSGLGAATGRGLRRARRRRAAPRGRAGRRQLRVALVRPRYRRPRSVCARQLAAPPAPPHDPRAAPRPGVLGTPPRALLRHPGLPGAEREPAPRPGMLPVGMQTSLLKSALRGFDPYVPGHQPPDGEGWVKLNTNESPWPPSPKVLDAVRAAVNGNLRLYPEAMAQPAREAIAHLRGVDPTQVALGNGADEVIAMCFRAFAGAGTHVAFPHPSYPLFEPLCAIHEVRAAPHALKQDWEPPGTFAEDDAPLKFLVNPNSPTGTWVDQATVQTLVQRSRGVVVL